MAKPDKLDIIWASEGTSVDPTDSKFKLGWVAEIPPYQYFNYYMNKASLMLDHVNTYGIPVWDNITSYQIGSKVIYNGVTYTSKSAHSGQTPAYASNYWRAENIFLDTLQTNAINIAGNITQTAGTASFKDTVVTGSLTADASSAIKLKTARTITLEGDVDTVSNTFDGTSNKTFNIVVKDDSHNHIISNVDGLQTTINNLTFPIGTVVMFDANTPTTIDGVPVTTGKSGAWVDNTTAVGWYACVNGNQSKGCPNLVDRFVMGKVVTGAGAIGGSNTHTISIAELPAHTHTANHSHTATSASNSHTHAITGGSHAHNASSGTQSASHTHSVTGGTHAHTLLVYNQGTSGNAYSPNKSSSGSGIAGRGAQYEQEYASTNYFGKALMSSPSHTHSVGNQSGNHSHTITVATSTSHAHTAASYSHSHTITVGTTNVTTSSVGSGTAIDMKPANYTIIYIRKCA